MAFLTSRNTATGFARLSRFDPSQFATGCHRLRPLCSINAPRFDVSSDNSLRARPLADVALPGPDPTIVLTDGSALDLEADGVGCSVGKAGNVPGSSVS
jgi:hypothetical protein